MKNEHGAEAAKMAQLIELPQLAAGRTGDTILDGNLDLLSSVKTRLSVVAGDASIDIGELLALRQGQVLKLDRQVDAPVDILLEGKVVARGQLVAVDDNFGVQITEAPGA